MLQRFKVGFADQSTVIVEAHIYDEASALAGSEHDKEIVYVSALDGWDDGRLFGSDSGVSNALLGP